MYIATIHLPIIVFDSVGLFSIFDRPTRQFHQPCGCLLFTVQT